jgi:serine/threonine-protein kinase LATS1/2
MQWKSYLQFPTSPRISQQGAHFIQSLLCDRKDRLGSSVRPAVAQRNNQRNPASKWLNFEASLQREGADELKAHPWFNGE